MSTGNPAMDNFTNETRFALMEQSINHMNQNFDQSMVHINQKLDSSIQQINQTLNRFEARFDKLDEEIKDTKKELKGDIRANFFWTLGVIGAMFGIMAHGFHWL